VEAGIGGNTWVFGPLIKRLILGGSSTGTATLARWHGLHVGLLPLVLLLLVGLPLLAHRLRGPDRTADHSSDNYQNSGVEPYYPFHLAREMVVALAVFLVVAGMAIFLRTPLEKEATAANLEGYAAMSEWYVLPLHALTLIPPFNTVQFEPLVTAVLPGLFFGALFVLPFIDRNPARALRKRPAAAAFGMLTVAGLLGLFVFAYITERPPAEQATTPAAATPVSAGPSAQQIAAGIKIYKDQGCDACHAISGKGGAAGPDLTHAGKLQPDRQWQIDHLKKPDSKVPGSTMPAYAQLKKEELEALADYMISLK